MRRRAIVMTTTTTLAVLTGFGWQSAGAAGDENTAMAEDQFERYLTANTTLLPLDVTCAPLPDAPETGPMICYALISDRQTVAALAELEAPGVYRFISISKVDLGGAPTSPAANSADAAVLELIGTVIAPDSRFGAIVMQSSPEIVSVDEVDFFESTGTIEVSVSTSAVNDGARNEIAFAITGVASDLWAAGRPLRDPAVTVQPRLEVMVDGTLYSSAFGMMTRIADGTMTYAEWIELTGVQVSPNDRLDRRADVRLVRPALLTPQQHRDTGDRRDDSEQRHRQRPAARHGTGLGTRHR
jgi:hypothetical protein